ncbi:protein DEK-like [Scleropages formosus]|uniref:Protein DEK-like n=1 Tax=Scleropages formosus TaxID=113540 RepID=A0A0P7UTV6_SCLFO|nr:protein DEK-like [Scleropages formosus]
MSGELAEELLHTGDAKEKSVEPQGAPAPVVLEGGGEGGPGNSPECQELHQKPEIIEGKREKKSVQRLDLQIGKPTEPVKIEEVLVTCISIPTGRGTKLGDIEQVAYYIGRMKADELKPLHKILFNRPGAAASLKKNIRQFSGFTFDVNSDGYNKKREVVKRVFHTLVLYLCYPYRHTMAGLKSICKILDLETSGNHSVRVDRIMNFLLNPKTRERPLPKKRKRTTSSKSKAIVDSSSDDEDGNHDKTPKSRETIDDDDSSSDDNDRKGELDFEKLDEEDVTDKDPQRKKTKALPAKKFAAKKQPAAKKKPASRKHPTTKKKMESIKAVTMKQKAKAKVTKAAEEEVSDMSELSASDNDSDHSEFGAIRLKLICNLLSFLVLCAQSSKGGRKRPATTPAKPTAKTKKADSSSSSSKMTSNKSKGSDVEDSSDEEPLIKLLKKPPTDEQLRDTINKLLKEANLEEVTMKHMYKKVFETYPEYDLTSRKPFIKETVKKFIS